MDALPFVDEHAQDVAATPEQAWAALVRTLPRAFGGARAEAFARAVGCEQTREAGDFPEKGSSLVGFRVDASDPPGRLVLVGRHRFARYSLVFLVEPLEGAGARVRARTYAAFPGAFGAAYRLAVIGTRMHVLVVRRILAAVARRAAVAAAPAPVRSERRPD